ncbi:MAG TPA: hypothetical protein VGI79_19005 [Caulobacteraceae bacterium]
MAAVEKPSIALTPELAADFRRGIALEELRRLWRESVNDGEGKVLDAEEIKRCGRERLAAHST